MTYRAAAACSDSDAMLVFQLVRLNDSLAPVSESELTSIVHELLELTEGPNPMSAADLSASVEVMLRVTLIYRSRRHSLILHRSLMDVSLYLLFITAQYFDPFRIFFTRF